MLNSLQEFVGLGRRTRVQLHWVRRAGWLAAHLRDSIPQAPRKHHIEQIAEATNKLGPQRLADEYGEADALRTPDIVRSSSRFGDLYAWLVQQRRPAVVVEFGSAFGVSGMYFAAGLEAAGTGHLFTFEINRDWADIADRNIRGISTRFTLTRGAFEDHVDSIIPGPIDLAFVDAIHTYEFVMRQFAILAPRTSPGAIIAFDDIDFSKPGACMREAWLEIAKHDDVVSAVEVNNRLGLVELH